MKKNTNPFLLYLGVTTSGSLLTLIILVTICSLLNFDSKSAICVCYYGVQGYILKTIIFSITYLFLYNKNLLTNKPIRTLIALTPFILFFIWYLFIIVFQVDYFFTDISFGYIYRFPHFYAQLLAVLIISIITAVKLNRRYKSGDLEEVKE